MKKSVAVERVSGENGFQFSRGANGVISTAAPLTMQPDKEAAMANSPFYSTTRRLM